MPVVFLDLFVIRQPLHAIASISHRMSGILMIFLLPWWTCGLYVLRTSSAHEWHAWTTSESVRLLTFISFLSLSWHALLGLRHLLIDMGVFSHASRNSTAILTFIIWVCLLMWVLR